jgi:hypothetical protein
MTHRLQPTGLMNKQFGQLVFLCDMPVNSYTSRHTNKEKLVIEAKGCTKQSAIRSHN